jgi:hypothetical protein
LVCTKLKTKFNSYSSVHIFVTEDEFPLINNIGVWSSVCLIAPYYGKLTPDQIFTPSTPEVGAPAAAIKSAADPVGNDGAKVGQLDIHLNMTYFSDASTGGSAMSNANFGKCLGIYYQNVRGLRTK